MFCAAVGAICTLCVLICTVFVYICTFLFLYTLCVYQFCGMNLYLFWAAVAAVCTFCGFCWFLQNALTSIVIPQLEIMMMIMMAGMRMMMRMMMMGCRLWPGFNQLVCSLEKTLLWIQRHGCSFLSSSNQSYFVFRDSSFLLKPQRNAEWQFF